MLIIRGVPAPSSLFARGNCATGPWLIGVYQYRKMTHSAQLSRLPAKVALRARCQGGLATGAPWKFTRYSPSKLGAGLPGGLVYH